MSKAARPEKFRDRWRVRWLDPDGTRKSKVFEKYFDAERFLRDQQVTVERVKAGIEARAPDPHTFDELCDYWLAHRAEVKRSKKDDTSIIEAHLRPAFGGLQLSMLGVKHVDTFLRGRRHLSPKTIHNHLTLLISMMNLAVDLGWLRAVPRIKKPRLVAQEYNWLRTSDDIRRLLNAARVETAGVMEVYATAVYTGLRAGEVLGLRWDDIDFERRLITVKRSYDITPNRPTKSGEIRHVPILDPLLPVLREWRLRCPGSCVFPGRNGDPQGPSARVLQEVFKRCKERAALGEEYSGLTFHDLRHTLASHWVMRGGDLYRLQKILGHKSVQMTQRYAHLAPEVFQEDWGRLQDAVPKEGLVLELSGKGKK